MEEHKKGAKLCDICKRRPAVLNVVILHNGVQTVLDLCEYDYFSINLPDKISGTATEESLESLKSFNEIVFNMKPDDSEKSADREDRTVRDRNSFIVGNQNPNNFNLDTSLSATSQQTLEEAGTAAISFGRTVVDTEHLLFALLEDRIVGILMDILHVNPEELRKAISLFALKGDYEDLDSLTEIPISPNVGEILQKAYVISVELGSQFVEPEHLLISICENNETLPGSLLIQSGVTSSKLKRPELRVLR